MKITMTGCLHGEYPQLPGGDLLIITGDLIASYNPIHYINFYEFCRDLPYRKIILVAGNHDSFIQNLKSKYFPPTPYYSHCEYLCDSGTEFEGLKIWGSPHSLWFHGINPHCTAFTGTEKDLEKKFALIPNDTDILITHSPPHGILDKCRNGHVGSITLRNIVLSKERMPNLKLHCFSHIHEQGNKTFSTDFTTFVNCSHMDGDYEAVNPPVSIEL